MPKTTHEVIKEIDLISDSITSDIYYDKMMEKNWYSEKEYDELKTEAEYWKKTYLDYKAQIERLRINLAEKQARIYEEFRKNTGIKEGDL